MRLEVRIAHTRQLDGYPTGLLFSQVERTLGTKVIIQ